MKASKSMRVWFAFSEQ